MILYLMQMALTDSEVRFSWSDMVSLVGQFISFKTKQQRDESYSFPNTISPSNTEENF